MSRSGDDSDAESELELEWLLGFVDPPPAPADLLRHRFPSKVGGRPAWLDPLRLPTRDQLTCPATGRVLQFLIQVYAPVDDNPDAFHRTMYVFVSPDGSTLAQPGAVRALRCQLPRRNGLYGFDPAGKDQIAPPALPDGYAAAEALARDPWRAEEAAAAAAAAAPPPPPPGGPALFAETELVVEPEPEDDGGGGAAAAAALEQYKKRAETEGEYDEEELPGDVVDSFEDSAPEAQRHFAEFAARVAREPEQVLRYCFEEGAAPLCPAPGGAPPPPPCPRCRGPRRFEFQVMPQLLNHLGVDASEPKAPDWGTIAVFSCAASCGGGEADVGDGGSRYFDEWVWVQPPV